MVRVYLIFVALITLIVYVSAVDFMKPPTIELVNLYVGEKNSRVRSSLAPALIREREIIIELKFIHRGKGHRQYCLTKVLPM